MRTLLTLSLALLVAALPVMGQVKDHRNIKYPDLPELKPEKPQIFTLNNGLKIFLIEDHEVPMIEVEARIRTGSNYVPLDKTGLSDIFGQVQREGGTESMTGDEIDDFLETRAASIETGLGGDSGFAQMDCLKEDFRDVVRLFSDVLRKPVFEEDKIEVAKQQVKTGIARRNDNVGGVVGREFNKLIRGADSPLAAVAEYETVASVSRDDLVAWHGKYYHPNSTMLGVVGDFDTEQMKDIISEVFGDWERGPDFSAPEPHYQDQVEPGVYYIEKADVTQANIRMGHLGIRTSNPDYYAVQVMNEVLGGGFAGRLFSNVRSKKGLAYSVFGGVGSSLPRRGVFQAGMSTQSEKMAESVEALKAEVLGIIETPPTPGGDEASQGIDPQLLRLQLHLEGTDPLPADALRLLRLPRRLPGDTPEEDRGRHPGRGGRRGQEVHPPGQGGAAGRRQCGRLRSPGGQLRLRGHARHLDPAPGGHDAEARQERRQPRGRLGPLRQGGQPHRRRRRQARVRQSQVLDGDLRGRSGDGAGPGVQRPAAGQDAHDDQLADGCADHDLQRRQGCDGDGRQQA